MIFKGYRSPVYIFSLYSLYILLSVLPGRSWNKRRTYNRENEINAAALTWSFTVITCERHKHHTDRTQNKAG